VSSSGTSSRSLTIQFTLQSVYQVSKLYLLNDTDSFSYS
jgi:hypothetical protein